MVQDKLVECSFFIPITRDGALSDGKLHSTDSWEWLDNKIYSVFDGGPTIAPGLYQGFYRDPDTNEKVGDQSHKYIVAVRTSKLGSLRDLLIEACEEFQQKCIYLNIAGTVEFVSRN